MQPTALAAGLGDPRLRLLDASWYHPSLNEDAAALYAAAHLPGAARFDIDAVAAGDRSLPHMLPDAAGFAAAAGALGIAAGDRVLVYDQTGIASAACRVWWTCRCFGQEAVAVLDGGLPAWRAAGLPLESGPVSPRPVARDIVPASLPIWDLEKVKANIDTAERLLLDARSAGRFAGRDEEPWGEPGRIPGSDNLPYDDLLDSATGRFLPADELAARFAARNIGPDSPLVLSCGSGVTACVLAFALHRLGWMEPALYDGSWAEWIRRPGTPRHRG